MAEHRNLVEFLNADSLEPIPKEKLLSLSDAELVEAFYSTLIPADDGLTAELCRRAGIPADSDTDAIHAAAGRLSPPSEDPFM